MDENGIVAVQSGGALDLIEPAEVIHREGAGAPPPVDEAAPRRAARVMPVRVREVDVPEYPGFTFTMRVNFKSQLLTEISSGETGRVKAALRAIVIEHNGWGDEDGNPFPDAQDDDFYEAIPTELAAVVIAVINTEVMALPNSLAPMRQR